MKRITSLPPGHVFVFGSNEAGVHGAGAAKDAQKYFGAKRGVGFGLRGQSFAIPTKAKYWMPALPLGEIESYVGRFLAIAREQSSLTFILTPIGCGLAGYQPDRISPMFRDVPDNVILPDEFLEASIV